MILRVIAFVPNGSVSMSPRLSKDRTAGELVRIFQRTPDMFQILGFLGCLRCFVFEIRYLRLPSAFVQRRHPSSLCAHTVTSTTTSSPTPPSREISSPS